MSTQTVTIEVAPQVAAILEKLGARAEAQGVTLDALLRNLLPIAEIGAEQSEMTAEDWMKALREWIGSHGSDTPVIPDDSGVAILGEPKKLSHNEKLAALQRLEERQANRPFTEAGDTVAMLREARSGAMWGYEPTE